MNHKRNTLFVLFILSVGVFNCQEETKRPNILFILSDDHTAQSWGIYGSVLDPYIDNPNIKYLAANGVKLNNAFCTNSICVPSRATILTGQYSHKNGVYDLNDALPTETKHIGHLFQENGYQTALIGKWHLKKEPQGFDEYLVLPGQGRYMNPILKSKENWEDGNAGGKVYQGFSSDVIADESIGWLNRKDEEKPFLLFTHFKATHEPFYYPERLEGLLADVELPYPESFEDWGKETTGRTHDGWPLEILKNRFLNDSAGRYPGKERFNVDGLSKLEARKKTYQRFVKSFLRSGAAIDENIGKLIAHLKESGELENTIIIYTADQGYFLGEHGFFDKRFIYEPSLRMPFVISYPRELPKNEVRDALILNTDFSSLLMDFADIEKPESVQGESFKEILNGKGKKIRNDFYYRYYTNSSARPAHFGIRNERYKLAFFYGQDRTKSQRDKMLYKPGWEFYDLDKDPHEQHNTYTESENQEIIRNMKIRLLELQEETGDDNESNPIITEIIEKYWEE